MNWIPLNEAQIQADFPTDLLPLYTQWVADNPAKAGRLAAIIERTAQEFRDSILSNPSNSVDPDPVAIPTSCLRHAETIVFYNLMMEMGLSVKEEAQESNTRADMFLRQITYKHFKATAEDSEPSPHYEVPENATLRTLPALLITFHFLLLTSALAGWVDSSQPGGPLYSLQEIDPVWNSNKSDYVRFDSWPTGMLRLAAITNRGKLYHRSPALPSVGDVITPQLRFEAYPQFGPVPPGNYVQVPGDAVLPATCVVVSVRQWCDCVEGEPCWSNAYYGLDLHGAQIRNATYFGDGSNLSNLPAALGALSTTGGTMTGSIDMGDGDFFRVAGIFGSAGRKIGCDDGVIEGPWSFATPPGGLTNLLPVTGGTMSGPLTNSAGYYGDARGLTNISAAVFNPALYLTINAFNTVNTNTVRILAGPPVSNTQHGATGQVRADATNLYLYVKDGGGPGINCLRIPGSFSW